MLTFLLGRSHSGKTQRVLSQLAALPESGRPVYLLLPDQSTFEGERRCYRTLGARAFSKIQVTGFPGWPPGWRPATTPRAAPPPTPGRSCC